MAKRSPSRNPISPSLPEAQRVSTQIRRFGARVHKLLNWQTRFAVAPLIAGNPTPCALETSDSSEYAGHPEHPGGDRCATARLPAGACGIGRSGLQHLLVQ